MLERVAFVGARLWTWELVTNFDSDVPHEKLLQWLREDFPETLRDRNPVCREMVGFNSSGGRRHRFLVALPEKDVECLRRHFDRVLPQTAMLYGAADALMRTNDGFGNLRYAVLAESTLYILVFFEGRLCHWTEEVAHDNATAEERLERFDEFLMRDDLFSRAESWRKVFVESKDFSDSQRKALLKAASRDPFWKDYDLDLFDGIKPRAKWRLAFAATFAVALFFSFVWRGSGENVAKVDMAAPSLSVAPEITVVDHPMGMSRGKDDVRVMKVNSPEASFPDSPACLVQFKIRGIVGGRLVRVEMEDGRMAWFRTGDSLGNFRVESIGGSKVSLACGGRIVKVENGM